MRWAFALLLAGCAADPVCEDAPVVAWENFGDGFVRGHCQGCHASTAPDRHGAPHDVTFDAEADVRRRADDVLALVESGAMPPGGGVTDDDLALLRVWLGCGI